MKSKHQKIEEMKRAKELLDKSGSLLFADFTNVPAEDVRRLRNELKKSGARFLVIKKRLLGLLLKEKGINADLSSHKISIGTVFAEGGADTSAGPTYRFFAGLEVPEGGTKTMWTSKILGGYDVAGNTAIDADQMLRIGTLPPREVLLAQLLGVMSGPVRAFLYLLSEKAKQGGGDSAAEPQASSEASATESEVAPAAPSEEPAKEESVKEESATAEESKPEESKSEEEKEGKESAE